MDQQIKAAWVKRLRSADDLARWVLREGDRFCSIGHLCDLYVAAHPDARWTKEGILQILEHGKDWFEYELVDTAPGEAWMWAGIEDCCPPALWYNGDFSSLDVLNDAFTLSPGEIADLIEAQL